MAKQKSLNIKNNHTSRSETSFNMNGNAREKENNNGTKLVFF